MWGAPRIHGELLKLGIEVAQSTVAKYLGRQRKPPSQPWRTFLANHVADGLDRLFHGSNGDVPGFVCLRRTVACSTSRSALPCDGAPDPGVDDATASGSVSVGPSTEISAARSRCDLWLRVRRHHEGMGVEEVVTAPRAPWQNPFVERLVGSIRRECLDHIIVWNERSLRRTLQSYFAYYERSRTHLALAKDTPEHRAVEQPEQGHSDSAGGGTPPPIPATRRLVGASRLRRRLASLS